MLKILLYILPILGVGCSSLNIKYSCPIKFGELNSFESRPLSFTDPNNGVLITKKCSVKENLIAICNSKVDEIKYLPDSTCLIYTKNNKESIIYIFKGESLINKNDYVKKGTKIGMISSTNGVSEVKISFMDGLKFLTQNELHSFFKRSCKLCDTVY